MRGVWVIVPAAVIGLAWPTPGVAATAQIETKTTPGYKGSILTSQHVRFAGAPGERNAVTVRADSGRVVFHDAAAEIVAGQGCTTPDAHTAMCSPRELIVIVDVEAGDGDDAVTSEVPAGGAAPYIDGGPGDDVLSGDENKGVIAGGEGDDVLRAGGDLDVLWGGDGRDRLEGGDGNDLLHGDAAVPASDTLDGGAGADTVHYSNHTEPVRVDLADEGPDGASGEEDVLREVENVEGGLGSDELRGDAQDNELDGSPASQRRRVGDVVEGRDGDDSLQGGAGDDHLRGGSGTDALEGWGGHDRYLGGGGNDRLLLDFDNLRRRTPDRLSCGAGSDLVSDPDIHDVVPRACERVELDFIGVSLAPQPYRGGQLHFRIDIKPDRSTIFGRCAVVRLGEPERVFGKTVARLPRRGVAQVAVPLTPAGRAALRRRPARIPVRFANYAVCRNGRGLGFASRGAYTARL